MQIFEAEKFNFVELFRILMTKSQDFVNEIGKIVGKFVSLFLRSSFAFGNRLTARRKLVSWSGKYIYFAKRGNRRFYWIKLAYIKKEVTLFGFLRKNPNKVINNGYIAHLFSATMVAIILSYGELDFTILKTLQQFL